MKDSRCFLCCLSVLLFGSASLVAQNAGVISGTVTDSTQAVVPSAPVTIAMPQSINSRRSAVKSRNVSCPEDAGILFMIGNRFG